MTDTNPTVREFMTPFPHTIGIDQSLAKAEKMMLEHGVQHLPVLAGGKLVGILSDRDIKLVESFRDVDPEKTMVAEAFTPDPYVVSPNDFLAEVCREMEAHHYGSALVCEGEKLVGIFTWIDALRALNQVLAGPVTA